MVSGEQASAPGNQRTQRLVTGASGSGFWTLTPFGTGIYPEDMTGNIELIAELLAVIHPSIGLGLQSVMNMCSLDGDVKLCSDRRDGMEQYRRVEATAVGDEEFIYALQGL